jgi:Na+/H+ antiporter NhaC
MHLDLPLVIAAVISGGIFGDHASPISDTTIISSMASGCDHIEHVRTQIPYALIGGGLAAAAFLFSGWIMV